MNNAIGGSAAQQACLTSWGIPEAAYASMQSARITRVIGFGKVKCIAGFLAKMDIIAAAEALCGEVPTAQACLFDIQDAEEEWVRENLAQVG